MPRNIWFYLRLGFATKALRIYYIKFQKAFSMTQRKPTDFEEKIGSAVVHAAFTIHKELGPGLLERVYEVCMEHELKKSGFEVKRQVNIPIWYDGIWFDEGLRLDLLINDCVIVE